MLALLKHRYLNMIVIHIYRYCQSIITDICVMLKQWVLKRI